ncbi:hypothetical protein P775_23565 [Puniceibacterium antarcticum]|uniref:Uncharacterized protein n=1 Tax=Puniceibacterium antarcticum TaxID=1206336 RepID=A0A2G8R833_9RHOB|nr:hypothetical protein [Puniceibacterium antarcticum]PIL17699.1 hypothetical protein P775_23565 [Puniceibacterium antarcticum]
MNDEIQDYKADFRKAGCWEQMVLENPVLEKRLQGASDKRLKEVYSILGGSDIVLMENPTASGPSGRS